MNRGSHAPALGALLVDRSSSVKSDRACVIVWLTAMNLFEFEKLDLKQNLHKMKIRRYYRKT